MSSPRDRDRDLRLERLGDRDGLRPAHLGESAQVASPLAGASSTWEFLAAYEALIDAVFTAPGASEWLSGLRRAVAALLADKDPASRVPAIPRSGGLDERPGTCGEVLQVLPESNISCHYAITFARRWTTSLHGKSYTGNGLPLSSSTCASCSRLGMSLARESIRARRSKSTSRRSRKTLLRRFPG